MIPAHNGHKANGLAPLPPAIVEEAPPAAPELAGVLSPSQCSTWLSCGAKWWFRYGLQLPDRQGAARAIGKALHATARENFTQKMETRVDLDLPGALAIYHDAWESELAETEFQADEDTAEMKAMGARLVTTYIEKVAPLIDPAAVELAVEGVIGGVPVRGYVDVLDVHGRIIDLKSAKTSPPKDTIRPDYRFQIATYAAITPGATGAARLDTIVKLQREIKIVPQVFSITPADQRHVEVMYPLAQEGMRSGLYAPQRSGFLCSRKYCGYWRACEKEFGGEVKP